MPISMISSSITSLSDVQCSTVEFKEHEDQETVTYRAPIINEEVIQEVQMSSSYYRPATVLSTRNSDLGRNNFFSISNKK